MDDGKCLLDVISDPQALKEFFRSPSQIAFVEGNIPPLSKESDTKKSNIQGTSQDTSRSTSITFSTCSSQTSQSSRPSSTLSGRVNEQTTPLAHFSFISGSINPQEQVPNSLLSTNSGLQNNIEANSFSTANNSRVVNTSVHSSNKLISASNVQNANMLSSSKPTTSTPQTFANVPLSFAFSDAGKARNVLSSGPVSLSSIEKPMAGSPKQTMNQQPQSSLKVTPPRLVSSPQAGHNTVIRAQNLKGSPLPTLRPKGIMPKPQTSPLSGTSQVTMQGNPLSQGIKTTPVKGQQQLVSIRPKLLIAQPSSTETGLSQSNLGTLTSRPKQTMQNSFTLGAKVQQQVPKQLLSSLSVPQLKSGVSTQPVGKLGLTGLVQLQPKQIAPKPEVPMVQTIGKSKLAQDQAQLQLVQSLLAQSQAQFGIQSNVSSTAQKILKEATNLNQESLTQQQRVEQQNQLKKLLQQSQLMQQARAQQQQQQQQKQQQQQQSVALLQLKSPPASTNNLIVGQQPKLQVPASQTTISASTLASQLKEAINTKQLQQFLEKNPIVAQQLKQLNMRQAALAGNARPPGLTTANTAPTTVTATAIKTATQPQQTTVTVPGPLEKPTLNQVQLPQATVTQLQKPPVNQLQIPTTVRNQLQKPVINQLPKAVATVQKPVTTVTSLLKPVATIAQLPSTTTATVSHVTIPIPKKSVASTGQVTQLQKTDQKTATAQKVVIVQQANVSTPTATAGQPKVLLQTKEGRPILLSQEQFRQLQAQLASKNLSIQGKLVTTSPVTTTATTVKPHVVVKSEANPVKVGQKVVTTTSKAQTKQEVSKAAKRPIKPVETQESKMIKRMKLSVQKDQNDVCLTDIHKPFKTRQDAIKRLIPYHVYSEPIPNARMQRKANTLLDKLAMQLTHKSDKMINKYRQLLLNDMQRDVPSAEVVMVNRIFLADEKAALMNERKDLLEEAKQMANSAKATLALIKTNATPSDSNSTEVTTSQTTTIGDLATVNLEASEPAHIEISDDDSSPITSANSFLTEVNTPDSDLVGVKRTLEPG